MRVIKANETPAQIAIRLEMQAIREEYEKRIEPLVKQYAALQMPPSYFVEESVWQSMQQHPTGAKEE